MEASSATSGLPPAVGTTAATTASSPSQWAPHDDVPVYPHCRRCSSQPHPLSHGQQRRIRRQLLMPQGPRSPHLASVPGVSRRSTWPSPQRRRRQRAPAPRPPSGRPTPPARHHLRPSIRGANLNRRLRKAANPLDTSAPPLPMLSLFPHLGRAQTLPNGASSPRRATPGATRCTT
jgi:hypothetical protein